MRVPTHPRCRCLKTPYSKSWQEKGITDDAFVKDFRDRTLDELRADGQKPNNGPTYWEKKAGLTTAPKAEWSPDTWVAPPPEPTIESRTEEFRQFAIGKLKEQTPDLIVNTAGVVGSIVGENLAGPAGALAGDLLGAGAARQAVTLGQAILSAKQKLRSRREATLRAKVDQLRELGRATLSEFNDPAFQRQYMNDLTGDVGGWGIGNSAAIVGNMIPGVASIPMKGALVAMTAVPKVQKARINIVDRFKKKRKREKKNGDQT